jgi:hypothetical protein
MNNDSIKFKLDEFLNDSPHYTYEEFFEFVLKIEARGWTDGFNAGLDAAATRAEFHAGTLDDLYARACRVVAESIRSLIK